VHDPEGSHYKISMKLIATKLNLDIRICLGFRA